MGLTQNEIDTFYKKTFIVSLDDGFNIKSFQCKIPEYNNFLTDCASVYDEAGVSKTHLLIDKSNANIIGYITLCTDAIRLSNEEKNNHKMGEIPFPTIPAVKLAKLAVDERYKGKNYSKFLIEVAKGLALELNESGVACRFLTVDADIRYGKRPYELYTECNFAINTSYKPKDEIVNMRLDLFTYEGA